MEKIDVVAAFGQTQLLRPAQIKAALAANDRLKFYLTALQAAWTHADAPEVATPDLRREYATARMDAPWLLELPAAGRLEGAALHPADLPRLAKELAADLRRMGRPLDGTGARPLLARIDTWCEWLEQLQPGVLQAAQLKELTGGRREEGDSFHILVMDLHKALNRLAAELADDTIDGAQVWQLRPEDRAHVAAFMRGLNRTRSLKLDHPGLDTAATSDGDRLLIQNDIGTNDAHVLVVQVEGLRLSLTYSDLHRQRFAFFQDLLRPIGASWSGTAARTTAGLNAGAAYHVGTATVDCADPPALDAALEGLGARIVFLIDWNRARKRLRLLVGKRASIAILTESAGREVGHMGWLEAGGEQLLFQAMEAVGSDFFRIGDRLDTVLGEEHAAAFMIEVLASCHQAMRQRQPLPRIADSVRLLLLRHLGQQRDAFGLLGEHAAFCLELAEGLRDALAHGRERDAAAVAKLAHRAKRWERQADLLVMRSRERAARSPRWAPLTRVIERADDIADALEEAAFLLSLIGEGHHKGWNEEVRDRLLRLAQRTSEAIRDHVRALAIAGVLHDGGTAEDHESFLAVSWRAVDAEQQCDELLRDVRRAAARHLDDPVTLALTADLAQSIETATDALLATSYGVRELTFSRIGARE
ncbi:DUF47 domain-containing protein [Stella sp.]|uniref:DUF47 domain-containing protein n=1 Tax=Stella sp. TaxID=2912054 RepID=UPI0035B0BDC2